MSELAWMIVASAVVPLARAWRVNAGSTIRHPLAWAGLAWLGWLAAALWPGTLTTYAALTFTVGAGVAVLGARRPGVAAWNAVVFSLLAVLWLAWAEGLLVGADLKLGGFRLFFLAVLLGITVVNYVPTRLMLGAIFLGVACASSWQRLHGGVPWWPAEVDAVLAGLSPWLAWLGLLRRELGSTGDERWRRFRDRFGIVWASRLREQFQAAARNAGWPVELTWRGLTFTGPVPEECEAALFTLQKRFSQAE